ncbi:MAG TPA: hypothetical protein VMA75_00525 [Candidatus Paceibacterota bacterium]|nr:hypothetical protein [Candidatus Paceibacterota bacterium]
MAIRLYHQKLKAFDEYLAHKGIHRGKVQTLVEFYRFLNGQLDTPTWTFPFSRHLKAAQKILIWSQDDLAKAKGFIFDCWYHYHRRYPNWNLDTAYRNIPLLYDAEKNQIEHAHQTLSGSEKLGLLEAITQARSAAWSARVDDDEERAMIAKAKEDFLHSLETGD